MSNCAIIYTEPREDYDSSNLPVQFRPIAGIPLLAHTISVFENCAAIDEIVLVADEQYLLYISESIVDRNNFKKVNKVRVGGETRFKTVLSGLDGMAGDTDIVLIHDGLRPFITAESITGLINECDIHNAVALGIRADMPVKRAEEGYILASLDKNRIYLMQSPQVFKYGLIMEAYRNALSSTHVFSDDAAVVERYGHKIKVMEGDKSNFRVASEREFQLAKYLIESDSKTGGGDD
jgi:2-C-methyl-D-erythritol 4-phosphate cytidylyltransferase